MLDIMNSDLDRLSRIFHAFNGNSRVWALKVKKDDNDFFFTERFRVSNAKELLEKINQYGSLTDVEFHFQIGLFNETDQRVSWTMIFDIDQRGCSECKFGKAGQVPEVCPYYVNGDKVNCLKLKSTDKKLAATRLTTLLKEFEIFYLIDTREHIWIPEWETTLVSNWNDLCCSGEMSKLTNWLERVLSYVELNTKIDLMLLSSGKHLIRCIGSYHMESGEFQVFKIDGALKNLSEEEILDFMMSCWDGSLLDKQSISYSSETKVFAPKLSTYDFAGKFKTLLQTALSSGAEIKSVTEEKVPFEDNNLLKSTPRPCLSKVPYNATDDQRFVIGSELINCGWNDDQIVELFKGVNDFSEEITRYRIGKIREGKYKRSSCEKLISMGFCLKDKCPKFSKRNVVS